MNKPKPADCSSSFPPQQLHLECNAWSSNTSPSNFINDQERLTLSSVQLLALCFLSSLSLLPCVTIRGSDESGSRRRVSQRHPSARLSTARCDRRGGC